MTRIVVPGRAALTYVIHFFLLLYDLVLQPTAAAIYVECLAVGAAIGCWGWGLGLLYTRCF